MNSEIIALTKGEPLSVWSKMKAENEELFLDKVI